MRSVARIKRIFVQAADSPIRPLARGALLLCWLLCGSVIGGASAAPRPHRAQTAPAAGREEVIIDTDIGDDIDDAFAVALALRSPEIQILGVTTTFGDTATRAKLLDRLLGEAGRMDIPVAIGIPTQPKTAFTQRVYAEGGEFTRSSHPQAVDFILGQIKQHPGEITLVCIGPLFNVGAIIQKDPPTFRQLKRVVMMGGSINRGYGNPYDPLTPPSAEWNIVNDISGAQKLFEAGVPIYMMPLDSTQLKMDETKRDFLFRQATPLTEALSALYYEWGQPTPTLFDPMTIAFIDKPELCLVQPMHIVVDEKGFTLATAGPPNAQVCLKSDPEAFFRFYLERFEHKAGAASGASTATSGGRIHFAFSAIVNRLCSPASSAAQFQEAPYDAREQVADSDSRCSVGAGFCGAYVRTECAHAEALAARS